MPKHLRCAPCELHAAPAKPDGERLRLRRAFGKPVASLVQEVDGTGHPSYCLGKWPDDRPQPFGGCGAPQRAREDASRRGSERVKGDRRSHRA